MRKIKPLFDVTYTEKVGKGKYYSSESFPSHRKALEFVLEKRKTDSGFLMSIITMRRKPVLKNLLFLR